MEKEIKIKNLHLLLVVMVIVLISSFKPAPTSDYEIVIIRGKEFIKSRVSGGYVFTKLN
jgi:hypothetical protein